MGAHSPAEEVFQHLGGKWDVVRHFEGSYRGVFSGEATLIHRREDTATYHYEESGELVDGAGHAFAARQRYRYRLSGDGLQVLKCEGSEWELMHKLDFSREGRLALAEHVHLCGEDHYAVRYRVDLEGGWELDYEVRGPKKDYRIRSVYTRADLSD